MPLPSVGGGYQYTDGNQNEITLGVQVAPGATTATSVTLTAAELTGGIYTSTNSSAVAISSRTATSMNRLLSSSPRPARFPLPVR